MFPPRAQNGGGETQLESELTFFALTHISWAPLGSAAVLCMLTGSLLKASLHFSGSLSLGHMAPYGSYENVPLPSPGVASVIDHSSSCGLLKSITTLVLRPCFLWPASS